MGNIITIDDGSEVFDIVNQRGEHLGQFTFIPSDFDIVNRYDETVKTFEELQVELERWENTDLNEISRKMCEKIDYLFAAPVSEKFFSITSPFTFLNSGQFFVENVINAIKTVIEQKRGIRLQAVQNRVKEYTQKYKAAPGGRYLSPLK